MTYPETMTFGRLTVGITQHAIDRFRERSMANHPNEKQARKAMRGMVRSIGLDVLASGDIPQEDGRYFWEGMGWRFVLKENPSDMAVVTCYEID